MQELKYSKEFLAYQRSKSHKYTTERAVIGLIATIQLGEADLGGGGRGGRPPPPPAFQSFNL